MPIERLCPNCDQPLTLDVATVTVRCKKCGYTPMHHSSDTNPNGDRSRARPPTMLTYRGTLEPRVRGMWDSAHGFLKQGNTDEAIKCFKSAVDYQNDFTDAYYWLAMLSEDAKQKRDYLETALAYDPNHPDALRELMVIDGRMTREQVNRTYHADEPTTQHVDQAAVTKTDKLLCPVCGGNLTVNEKSGEVLCRFCGHKEQRLVQRAGAEALGVALLERKTQPVKWVIGARLLHCDQCGAERTMPGRKMSQVCPFCGTNHVITRDAHDSFTQPDGVLPFKLPREDAEALIRERLESAGEWFKGLFSDNRVDRAVLEGVYVPYWVFDGAVDVTLTTVDRRASKGIIPYGQRRFDDAAYNVGVCAVSSPSPALLDKLGDFDWGEMVAYEAKLLARHPAELYSIDFDRASLRAHEVISKRMKARYDTPDGDQVETTVFATVKHMLFQLVLVPVWSATLFEKDGDVRPALVNARTGELVLGKAEKPKPRMK